MTITKAFSEKAANNPEGNEYAILSQLRRDFPTMRIITEKPSKRRQPEHGQLNYKKMVMFIKCQKNAGILQNEFEKARELSKTQKNPYRYVRTWFLNEFPNYNELPRFDSQGNLTSNFRINEGTKKLAANPKDAA
jgi:hypothetical protein